MKRPDGLIICDYHKRGGTPVWHGEVLDDGITIVPGYIEVEGNRAYEINSIDPNNSIDQAGVLKNRRKDQNGNSLISKTLLKQQPLANVGDTHFCNRECFSNFYKPE